MRLVSNLRSFVYIGLGLAVGNVVAIVIHSGWTMDAAAYAGVRAPLAFLGAMFVGVLFNLVSLIRKKDLN